MNLFRKSRTVLIAAAIVATLVLMLTMLERKKVMLSSKTPVSAQAGIPLTRPATGSPISIEEALQERRSSRQFRKDPPGMEEIAQLLWAAQGVTHGSGYRTAPSAGALYPLETYLVAGDVGMLPAGVYRYLPDRHELVLWRSGDMRGQLCGAALSQGAIREEPASIVFGAVFARTTGKYGGRGVRYVHMEAGIAAQNVSLQAVSLKLGAVVIGAFDDGEVRRVLSMPDTEEPMLIVPVGRVRGAATGP